MAVITAKVMTIRSPKVRSVPDGSTGKLVMFEIPLELAEKAVAKLKGDHKVEDFMTGEGAVWGSAWVPKSVYPKLRRVPFPATVELHARFLGATFVVPEEGADPSQRTLGFVLDNIGAATPWDGLEAEDNSIRVRTTLQRRRVMDQGTEVETGERQPSFTL
jgi:hypothetical protein